MSRALKFLVVLSAVATASAVALALQANPLAWQQATATSARAIAIAAWVITVMIWCTEQVCAQIAGLRADAAKREQAAIARDRRRSKKLDEKLWALEELARERIEAGQAVVQLFDANKRRANDR